MKKEGGTVEVKERRRRNEERKHIAKHQTNKQKQNKLTNSNNIVRIQSTGQALTTPQKHGQKFGKKVFETRTCSDC